MKNIKLAQLAFTVGGAIGLGISGYRIAKLKREIEETTREIERTEQYIADANERMAELANSCVYHDEEFERFLKETEKWINEMDAEEEES